MKTRLSIMLGLALLFIAQAGMAQVNIGIKGGATIGKIQGTAFKDEFSYGYHLGGFAEIGLGGKLGIQPEVLFNQYNTKVDSTFKNVYSNALSFDNYKNVKLNYLSIPLLLNYKLGSALSLQAGPQYSILMDQSKNLLQNGQSAFKDGDFALIGGATLKISKLRFSGRYIAGMNDIADVGNSEKWNSRAWQLSVGLAF